MGGRGETQSVNKLNVKAHLTSSIRAHNQGLVNRNDLNGVACLVERCSEEGDRWTCKLVHSGEEINVMPSNLKASTLKECISEFKRSELYEGDSIKVTGTPQGDRVPLFLLKRGRVQIGSVSTREIDGFAAWELINLVLNEMLNGETPFTKEAFYARREELTAM